MRRAITTALAAVLATALLLGPGAVASVSADSGATGSCTWTKHTKRVVRHVRRHGKVRRIVRLRHWWTCVPNPATPPPAPTPPPVPDPGPDPVGPERLGIESTEFSYTLSRSHVSAGDLIVELNNSGGDPHNLNIRPQGPSGDPLASIADVAPGAQGSVRFTIPAGTYYLYCSLPSHEAFGMNAQLIVDP